jgi:hypothetical protein
MGPQEVGVIIAFGGVICSLCTLVSVYLLMRLMPPRQIFVPMIASAPQPARSDVSRLRRLADSLPLHPPQDARTRDLSLILGDSLQRALTWASLLDESPDAARKGIENALAQSRVTFRAIVGA